MLHRWYTWYVVIHQVKRVINIMYLKTFAPLTILSTSFLFLFFTLFTSLTSSLTCGSTCFQRLLYDAKIRIVKLGICSADDFNASYELWTIFTELKHTLKLTYNDNTAKIAPYEIVTVRELNIQRTSVLSFTRIRILTGSA